MYHSTSNIIESLKASLMKQSYDNRIYESNFQNYNLDYLPFDGDEMLITRRQYYDSFFKSNLILLYWDYVLYPQGGSVVPYPSLFAVVDPYCALHGLVWTYI